MDLEQLKKINEQAYEAEVNGEQVKGFYLPSKHQIVLYVPNLLSEGVAESTIFHEGIAHFGLRELFGEEEFNNFCKQVWKVMSYADRKEMMKYLGKEYVWNQKVSEKDMLAAADEYVAHLAQTSAFVEYLKNRNEQEAVSWMNKKWKKVCDLIRKIFKKQTGVDIMSNEEKIMDALYRSYQLLGSEEYATFSYYRSLAEQMRKYDVKVGEIVESNGNIYDNATNKILEILDKGGLQDLSLQEIDDALKLIKDDLRQGNKPTLFKRFSHEELEGIRGGNERLAETLSIVSGRSVRASTQDEYKDLQQSLKSEDEEVARQARISRDELNEQMEEDIEAYAKAKGIWMDNTNNELRERYGDKIASGSEAVVYYDEKNKKVVKTQSTWTYGTLQDKLDAIVLHNFLFPQSSYTIEGFGLGNDGSFQVIVQRESALFAAEI